MPTLTQEFVRARLDYNPETGVLTWKARDRSDFPSERTWKTWMTRWFGKPAGGVYRGYGCVFNTSITGVIWLWVHGYTPELIVHKNGDVNDNRLANLAPCEPSPIGGRDAVTQEYALEAFEYDKETGKLYWKVRPQSHFRTARGRNTRNARYAGKEAGCINKFGRVEVRVGLLCWLAHRLIWLMHTGELPKIIDHIDRDPTNNRIENLRVCTHSENLINSRKRAAGKIAGVREVRPGTWVARMKVEGKQIHLGRFDSREEARQTYEKCVREKFGEFVPNV